MNIKREILFRSYRFFRKCGYLDKLNQDKHYANIITFHRVNNKSDALTIDIKKFDKMMKIVSKNYRVISLQSLIAKLNQDETLESNTVVITFDDGYQDNYKYAAPILRKYNLPATFFITTGYIGTDRIFDWDKESEFIHPNMTWDEVCSLSNMGFDIGAHTVNHVNLGSVSLDIAKNEILQSKLDIEEKLQKEIKLFAYPFGRKDCVNDEVIKIIKEVGFECCCSNYGGKVTKYSSNYNLHRIPAYPTTLELQMELDNYMTFYDGSMSILPNSKLINIKLN